MKLIWNTMFSLILSSPIFILPAGIHKARAANNTGNDCLRAKILRLHQGKAMGRERFGISESSAIEGESGHGEPYFMDLVSATTRNERFC